MNMVHVFCLLCLRQNFTAALKVLEHKMKMLSWITCLKSELPDSDGVLSLLFLFSSDRKCCHHQKQRMCDGGSEPEPQRTDQRGNASVWLGLGLHMSPAGQWGHRRTAGPALHDLQHAVSLSFCLVWPSIHHLLVPFAYDVATISVIGLSISLLSLCPIGLLAQPYMVSSMRSAPLVCLPILLSLCTIHLWLIHPSPSIHPSIHCLSVPSAYDVSAHLCHLSVHVCIYLSVMCPSISGIGLSIVYLSVISLSCLWWVAHLCHWSVHLCASVQPSFSLSISVLLSNRPSVCPSLCFCPTVLQSVHLCASVQPSFSLSIFVLLSNRPSVCPSLCFCPTVLQSVHLCASVQPSFSLSISVLLSNRPSVCPSLCFCPTILQSVHLCASVKPSFSLSISVLLSNRPSVCPADYESDLSSDCCLESSCGQKFLRLLLWLWDCDSLLIQLCHVLCRLLLWDCDDRSYSFYVEVSTDQQKWHRVADKSSEACKWVLAQVFRALWVVECMKCCHLLCAMGCRLYAVLSCAVH